MNIPKNKLDDLTKIDGIALARQELLRSRLGIRTYQDLAGLPPKDIVDLFKKVKPNVSLQIVEAWCAAARDLAAQDPPADPSEWNPFTSFVVEFQVRQDQDGAKEYCTVAQLMESEIEKKWQGISPLGVSFWMDELIEKVLGPEAPPSQIAKAVTHIVLPPLEITVAAPEVVQAAPESPEAPESLEAPVAPAASATPALAAPAVPSIEIQQITLHQPPEAMQPTAWCTPGGSFCGMLVRDQPFSVHVSLKITSTDLSQLHQSGIQCELQLFSRCVPGGRILPLGNLVSFPLQDGDYKYGGEFSLPAGTHHLKVLSKIMLSTVAPSYQEARFLMVL